MGAVQSIATASVGEGIVKIDGEEATQAAQARTRQLLAKPLSRDEFHRQPLLFPSFIAFDLELIEPKQSQLEVEGPVDVVVGNPGAHSLLAEILPRSGSLDQRKRCSIQDRGQRTIATCSPAESGDYVVYLFAALRGESKHDVVAKLEVTKI